MRTHPEETDVSDQQAVSSSRAPRQARPDGYATGRATKQSIVASAAAAFAQKGFYGASLRSIAREAGVDHSTLIHHFGNKTALLLAVVEWHDMHDVQPELPDDITAAELVDGFVGVAERNRSAPGLVHLLSMLSAEAGSDGHPARPALQQRHEVLVEVIGGMVRQRRQEGALPDDGLSPEVHAALVISTWEGLQVYDALHPGQLDVPDLVGRALRTAFGLR